MEKISYSRLMKKNPTKYGEIINQLKQKVTLYEHPTMGDLSPVIAVIKESAVSTDFFDTEDFYENSDYNPILLEDGNIVCAFELDSGCIKSGTKRLFEIIKTYTGCSMRDIRGMGRKAGVVEARRLACFVLHETYYKPYTVTLKDIAKESMGNSSHDVLLHHIQKHKQLISLKHEGRYRRLYKLIRSEFDEYLESIEKTTYHEG